MMKIKRKWMTIMTAAALAAGVACGCANPEKSGVEALKNGEYQEAEAQFQEMTQSGSGEDAAEGYRGLGMTYYEMEDYAGALEAFRQAVDNGVQQSVQLYNLMGSARCRQRNMRLRWNISSRGLLLPNQRMGRNSHRRS